MRTSTGSMCPCAVAAEAEIVGIGLAHRATWLWLHNAVGDAAAFGVGDRLLLGLEGEADLRLHVARARPAHQRIDLARHLRLVLEEPLLAAGRTRLHGGLCGL